MTRHTHLNVLHKRYFVWSSLMLTDYVLLTWENTYLPRR